jgi:hypothetical protein
MNDILGMSDILGLDDLSGEDAAAILGELLEGEDLSGDDLSGDDAAAILGAALRGKGKGKGMLQKAIMARKLGSAQVMATRKPSSSGVQPIGFFQAAIAAGTQAIITTQPQTWFKPMRLVVPGSIAPFFTIDNLIIGNKSQFPSPVPLPAETFIPEAQAVVMELDTVNPALNLTVVCTNISGVPQNFRATFVGKEVTP